MTVEHFSRRPEDSPIRKEAEAINAANAEIQQLNDTNEETTSVSGDIAALLNRENDPEAGNLF
jgi:hypothetical protein